MLDATELGTERGRIVLHTFRDGLAAQAGHDLTIEVGRWSGELTVNDDGSPADLEARIDMGSLIVREGTGGIKPLTDRDRREIAVTARKVLAADRHPEATFAAADVRAGRGRRRHRSAGRSRWRASPGRCGCRSPQTGPDRYHATATVVQSAYGIKPYTGFLGALKVRDAVDVDVDVDLSEPAGPGGRQPS